MSTLSINEVEINGEIYVKKSSLDIPCIAETDGLPVYMVRTYSAGVFYGSLKERNGKEVKLLNARRVWYWSGAATLSELAQTGTSSPKNCKFPQSVTEVELTEVIELIPVTDSALKTLNEVAIWTQN